MKKALKNIISFGFGLTIAVLLLELFLHFYNPINQRMSKGEIKLPVNMVYEIENKDIKSLPSNIKHSKNDIGFRGPSLSKRGKKTSVICIGGSTTECFYLNDGQDWPAVLQSKLGKDFWINNAGLDGHSTFGHFILLKNHVLELKPDYIIFLVGCNDIAASQINNYEKEFIKDKKRWLEYSSIFNTLSAMRRAKKARDFGVHHQSINFVHSQRTDTSGSDQWQDSAMLDAYEARIKQLATLCINNGIKPIFCSQPSILSAKLIRGTYVGNRAFQGESALHFMRKMHLFNKRVEKVCRYYHIDFIDLEKELEASPMHYYDNFHFTTKGSKEVAQIILKNVHL